MSVSVREIIASEQWKACLERLRADLTRKVMSKGASDEERQTALTKYHLLGEIEVDLSTHIQE